MMTGRRVSYVSHEERQRNLFGECRTRNQKGIMTHPYALTEGRILYFDRGEKSAISIYAEKIYGDKVNRSAILEINGIEGLDKVDFSKENGKITLDDILVNWAVQGRKSSGRKIILRCTHPSKYRVKKQ